MELQIPKLLQLQVLYIYIFFNLYINIYINDNIYYIYI